MKPIEGVLVVDKPPGCTSHDVVARVRRWVRPSRVGHTGTLDPAATGVLALCIGPATRLARFLTAGNKTYTGSLVLGVATETYDAEGRVTEERDPAGITLGDLRRAAAALTGDILQAPPPWSAKKIAGRRAYDMARSGENPQPEPCRVRVGRFEIEALEGTRAGFRVECSSGTYVRSLVNDLGRSVDCGAHLAELRRVRSGPFTVEDSRPLEVLEKAAARGSLAPLLRPLESIDLGLPSARLSDSGARLAASGRAIPPEEILEREPASAGQSVRLLGSDGRLVAIAEQRGPGRSGILHPRIVLERPSRGAGQRSPLQKSGGRLT